MFVPPSVKNVEVHEAGCMIVFSEMKPDNSEAVRKCMYNAQQAAITVMDSIAGGREEPFNIGWFRVEGGETVAKLEYNPGHAESVSGEPVRSDCSISLQYNINANQSNLTNNFEEALDLALVDVYTRLVYAPLPPAAIPGQVQEMRHYVPQIVITSLDSQVDAVTMELQLLAMAQATLMSHNYAWAGCFRPNHATKGLDIKDVGAIGYQVNLTADPNGKFVKPDTKSKSFGDKEFYTFIRQNVRDTVEYTIDIEEVGPLSWILQAFAAVAVKSNGKTIGDAKSVAGAQRAYDLIYNAADNLTMGEFKKVFQGGPITIDLDERVHLGYYIDQTGTRKDLRDIDNLALLNMVGKDDMSVVWKWAETFDAIDIPSEIRMEDRTRILKTVLPGVKIKGYARKYVISNAFLIALNQACQAAGLVIRPSNMIQDFSGTGVRGNANAGRYGLSGQDVSGLFNYSTNPWANYNSGPGGSFNSRFTRS